MTSNIKKLMKLVEENPNLPVVSMINTEVVGDSDYCTRWLGEIGESYIRKYICGEVAIHFFDSEDLVEITDTLLDMQYKTRELSELPDEELNNLYENLAWTEAIIVNIDSL